MQRYAGTFSQTLPFLGPSLPAIFFLFFCHSLRVIAAYEWRNESTQSSVLPSRANTVKSLQKRPQERTLQLPDEMPVVGSAQSKPLRLDGITVIYKVFGQDTGNLFSAVEHITDPGILVPPHMHSREDQFMYVLEGELVVRLGEHVFEGKPGAFVTKPRNVPHAFWNIGKKPARHLEIVSPPGFERFFEDLAKNQERPQSERTSVSPKYGMTNVDSWIPEIVSKYKVRLNGA